MARLSMHDEHQRSRTPRSHVFHQSNQADLLPANYQTLLPVILTNNRFPQTYIMPGWKEGGLGVAVAVVVVLLTTVLRPIIMRLRRRGHKPSSATLRVLFDPDDAKLEFVNSVGPRCRLH